MSKGSDKPMKQQKQKPQKHAARARRGESLE